MVFVKDGILVNDSKVCEGDGDCGEIHKIVLKGNGVWEAEEYTQLKNLQPGLILGEVRL